MIFGLSAGLIMPSGPGFGFGILQSFLGGKLCLFVFPRVWRRGFARWEE